MPLQAQYLLLQLSEVAYELANLNALALSLICLRLPLRLLKSAI